MMQFSWAVANDMESEHCSEIARSNNFYILLYIAAKNKNPRIKICKILPNKFDINRKQRLKKNFNLVQFGPKRKLEIQFNYKQEIQATLVGQKDFGSFWR